VLSPGTRLGPYTVSALLGSGGMGEVYRARDERLGRDVAIKVLPAHLAADSTSLDRFQREARAVASLSHPNIVSIFDVGREEGIDYAVTELLEGETLRARIARGKIDPREALGILLEIAEGVAAAHARGIIHRDLKPENVFITSAGRVKVLDFGLARTTGIFNLRDGDVAGRVTEILPTEPGVVIGTIGYLAPEQVEGRKLTPATDVFALGCMLFEMIAGKLPFVGESAAHSMVVLLHDPAPGVDDPDVDAILQRSFEKTPGDRFANAGELATAIRRVLPRMTEQMTVRVVTRKTKRSYAWLPLLALAIVIAALAYSGYVRIRDRQQVDEGYDLRLGDIRAAGDARRLVVMGLRADAEGDRPKAMQLFEEAHRRSTDTALPAAFLTSFIGASGNEPLAREWGKSAIARLPGASPYESMLVRYLVSSVDSDPSRDVALTTSVLAVRPEAWRMRLAAAHHHLNRRDRAAALRELKKVDVTKPDDRRLMLVLADRASLGDVDGASADLARSRLRNRPPFLHFTQARIAWSRGDLAGAQRLYDLAANEFATVNLTGLEIDSRMYSAMALLRLGEWQRALPMLALTRTRARQTRALAREMETNTLAAYAAAKLGDFEERDRTLAEAIAATNDPEQRASITFIAMRLGSTLWRTWPAPDTREVNMAGVGPLFAARQAAIEGKPDDARRLVQQARAQGVELTNFREETELLAAQLGMPHQVLPADPPYPIALRLLAVFDLEDRSPDSRRSTQRSPSVTSAPAV
jgi:tetratricopeptide (TPR) repeat protein